MKVALYARVSTEEQKEHGYSIDAQVAALQAWAKAGGHEVCGVYVDAGISGKKPYQKRPELLRFMQSLERGEKVDALVFCKLDRFYRSVKLYYQAVEVLDRHGVAWIAIHEDYETATSGGRLKVNILLSVAEAEADRTSERIKAVYDHKIALGQAINGSLPIGLKIEDHRIVPDEFAPAVVAAYNCYADTGSRDTVQRKLDAYGKHLSLQSIGKLLRNRLYIGEYRDNPNYCEAILSRELFDHVQDCLAKRSTKHAPSGRVYLFSGLVYCGICGRKMSARFANKSTVYYRCATGYANYKNCTNSGHIREDILEAEIIKTLAAVVKGKSLTVRQSRTLPSNKADIERKLARLRDRYVDGDMTKEQYTKRRDELAGMIREKKTDRPKIVLGDQFEEDYMRLSRQEKQVFFRRVIDRITVGKNGVIDVNFMDSYTNGRVTDVEL